MSARLRSIGIAVVAVTSIAAVAYFSYQRNSADFAQTHSKGRLHRSNAIRYNRPRRWRRGYGAIQFEQDPTRTALKNLTERERSGHGYGTFSLPQSQGGDSEDTSLQLLPSNLGSIYETLTHVSDQSHALDDLKLNIQAQFLLNFFHEEYEEGYILKPDLDQLKEGLAPDIDESLLETVIMQWDNGSYPESVFSLDNPTAAGQGRGMGSNGLRAREIVEAMNAQSEPYRTRRSHRPPPPPSDGDGNNVLDLLYRIGEEQAKRSGYHHRGVECNSCGCLPIRGIRYHCVNCWDYDLCESCEALQIHNRSHIFYKIRVPVPTRGQIKQVLPKWYPGNPNACADSIPLALRENLLRETNLDRQDLDALYEQYKCIAGRPLPQDPHRIGMTIDRRSFDMYSTTTTEDRPPLQNLIYDRIFAFYDKDADGIISFPEFAHGMVALAEDTTRISRLRRLFAAFDLDDDGFVDRKDFLRMMKAHYALSKEISAEMIYSQDDVILDDEEVMEAIRGTNPISAAFGGNMFAGHRSRIGAAKDLDEVGDLVPHEDTEILQEESQMFHDRARAIGNVAVSKDPRRKSYKRGGDKEEEDGDDQVLSVPDEDTLPTSRVRFDDITTALDPSLHVFGWPHAVVPGREDVFQALNISTAFEDVADPVDRAKVYFAQSHRFKNDESQHETLLRNAAIKERWQRRRFYLDEEEGMTKPPGYIDSESSEDEQVKELQQPKESAKSKASSRRPSLRSRSSSKVRFDDSAIDTDYETKSDISSRSIPLNERWGGYELGLPDKDIGLDIMYQAVEQGFNELLDELFKDKEDLAIEALRTKLVRKKYADVLCDFEKHQETAEEITRVRADAKPKQKEATIEGDIIITDIPRLLSELDPTDTNVEVVDDISPQGPTFTTEYSEDEEVDVTLPQNMPNEAGMEAAVAVAKTERENKFRIWLQHRDIDAEAEVRGGYGKLSFDELKRKLVGSISQENRAKLENEGSTGVWEEKASLGKFSFLSTWLEMATF